MKIHSEFGTAAPAAGKPSRSLRRAQCTVWIAAFSLVLPGFGQDTVSEKKFPPITLANHFSCQDPNQDLDLGCGFLLKHDEQVYAVSAKHILGALKLKGIDGVSHVCLEGPLKAWTMFSKQNPKETVALGELLNEDRKEKLNSAAAAKADWVVFEIKANASHVQPLELRTTPLKPGEKLYVVGWNSEQKTGPQRTYEFEYHKTIGTRILLKDVIVPAKLGGLSGAPVVDGDGLVVAIVSGGTVDPDTGKKMFSPCLVTGLVDFLDKLPAKKQARTNRESGLMDLNPFGMPGL